MTWYCRILILIFLTHPPLGYWCWHFSSELTLEDSICGRWFWTWDLSKIRMRVELAVWVCRLMEVPYVQEVGIQTWRLMSLLMTGCFIFSWPCVMHERRFLSSLRLVSYVPPLYLAEVNITVQIKWKHKLEKIKLAL